jgi:hypothetical protein
MNRRTAFFISVAAALWLPTGAFARADSAVAQTTFDSDLGGWTTNTPSDVKWNSTGGNPGGEALFTDLTSGVGTVMLAPSSFLSPTINFTRLNGKGYISYQHLMVKETGVQGIGNYNIAMSGPGGAASFTGALAIVLEKKNKWTTIVAPLVEADWVMSSGTWAGLLANVTSIQIPMEMVSNQGGSTDKEAMDNIEIVSHPSGFSPR